MLILDDGAKKCTIMGGKSQRTVVAKDYDGTKHENQKVAKHPTGRMPEKAGIRTTAPRQK
jgi:hypothetical protein